MTRGLGKQVRQVLGLLGKGARSAYFAVALSACLSPPAATPDAAPPPDAVPVACDGHLCKTDNGGTCNAGGGNATLLVAFGALLLRRRRR